MSKRQRSDSVTAAVLAAQAPAVGPPSNIPLDGDELTFFASIVEEFARAEWSAHQVELAALLARMMRHLRDEMTTLSDEGSVIVAPSGLRKVNPRVTIVGQLHASVMATRRSLQLHGRSAGKPGERARRNRDLKDAEEPLDDELLAKAH